MPDAVLTEVALTRLRRLRPARQAGHIRVQNLPPLPIIVAGSQTVGAKDRLGRSLHLLDVGHVAGIECLLHRGLLGTTLSPERALSVRHHSAIAC